VAGDESRGEKLETWMRSAQAVVSGDVVVGSSAVVVVVVVVVAVTQLSA
jgi:hypothetical protein